MSQTKAQLVGPILNVDDIVSFGNSSPPTWQTGGGYTNILLGNSGYLRADNDTASNFLASGVNAYRAAAGWKFSSTGYATQLTHNYTGELALSISSASGTAGQDITWSEKFRIDSSGNVGLGTTIPNYKLDVRGEVAIGGSSTPVLRWRDGSTEYSTARIGTDGRLLFEVSGNGESLAISTDGTVKIGNPATRTNINGNYNTKLQVEGTDTDTTRISIISNSTNNSLSPQLVLGKTSTADINSIGAVVDTEAFGAINFSGSDGTFFREGAFIEGRVDGTVSSGIVPGSIRFYVTDSTGTRQESVRIKSNSNVGIGSTEPVYPLVVSNGSTNELILLEATASSASRLYFKNTGMTNAGDTQIWSQNNDLVFNVSNDEKVRLDSNGNLGIGTTNPETKLHVNLTSATAYSSTTSATPTATIYNGQNQTGSYSSLRFRTSNSNGAASIWSIGNVSSSSNYQGDLFFQSRTGDSTYGEHLRITSTGHVGIGTNNPRGGDFLGTPALTVYGTNPIINIAQSQDLNADGDISSLVFAANDPRTTSSQDGRQMALIKARWAGYSSDTLDSEIRFYTATGASAASSNERARVSSVNGLTGNTIERFIPPGIYYYDAGTSGYLSNNASFLNTNSAAMNETGDRTRFGGFPTCYSHRKFIKVYMIYHGTGNVNGTVWSVQANIYWAADLVGYTQSSATINFDLPSVSNGKVYFKDLTSIWPTMAGGRIINADFVFTENIGGSTIFITGLQIVEATNPYS